MAQVPRWPDLLAAWTARAKRVALPALYLESVRHAWSSGRLQTQGSGGGGASSRRNSGGGRVRPSSLRVDSGAGQGQDGAATPSSIAGGQPDPLVQAGNEALRAPAQVVTLPYPMGGCHAPGLVYSLSTGTGGS